VRWRKIYPLRKVVYLCNLSHWDLPSRNAPFHAFDSVWNPSTSRGASRWIQRKIFFLKLWFLCSATKIRIWTTLEFSSYSFIPPQTIWTFLALFTSKLLFKVSYMLVNSYLMACSRLTHAPIEGTSDLYISVSSLTTWNFIGKDSTQNGGF
jgi:hypothetical protein